MIGATKYCSAEGEGGNMFELIFIIIVIAVIVSKVKAQNQGANRNNTTYINGKPVKNNRQQVYGAGQMNRQPQNYSACIF